MKPIATQFTANGFTLTQLERVNDIAIYRQAKPNVHDHFEVVRIRHHNGFKIPGTEQMAAPAETYPGNERWGHDGFTFPTLELAQEKMRAMIPLAKAGSAA